MLGFWLRGCVLGLAIAAPVGPIGVLCIRRTLLFGRTTGLLTGLGAATADMCYGAVAAFGLTAVSGALISFSLWIHLIGAAFLAWLGVRTALARPHAVESGVKSTGLAAAYGSTVLLTLSNPATILSFVAIFAGTGLAGQRSGVVAASLLVIGVFTGSALWWLILSTGVNLTRARFNLAALRWVNLLSGTVLLGFAAVAIATAR